LVVWASPAIVTANPSDAARRTVVSMRNSEAQPQTTTSPISFRARRSCSGVPRNESVVV
jgi:hypothetical protein